jgi:hypothetical protein
MESERLSDSERETTFVLASLSLAAQQLSLHFWPTQKNFKDQSCRSIYLTKMLFLPPIRMEKKNE